MDGKFKICKSRGPFYQMQYIKSNGIFKRIAEGLICNLDKILKANEKDIFCMHNSGIKECIIQSCLLDKIKIYKICAYIIEIGNLDCMEKDTVINNNCNDEFTIKRTTSPIGNIATVCGINPYIAIIMSIMCLKCGNNLVLFGSEGLSRTAKAMFCMVKEVIIESGLPDNLIEFVEVKSKKELINLLRSKKFDLVSFSDDTELDNIKFQIDVPYISICKEKYCCYIDSKYDKNIIIDILNNLGSDICVKDIIIHRSIYNKISHKYKDHINKLNIILVNEVEDVIGYINRDKYLSGVYIFSEDKKTINILKSKLKLLSICVNKMPVINDYNDIHSMLPVKFFINSVYNKRPMSLDFLVTYKYILEKRERNK